MTSPDFIEDCLVWRGRVLTGSCAHWCPEWDDLPIDETCPEWPCGCGFGDCKAICVLATTLEAAQARIADLTAQRNKAIAGWEKSQDKQIEAIDRAEFAEAQLEAVMDQLPPPEKGLLKKRLAERRALKEKPNG